MLRLALFIVSILFFGCAQKQPAPDPIVEKSKKLGRVSLPKDVQTENYYDWLQKNQVLIPEKYQQDILISYVKYLKDGHPVRGQKVIKLLKDAAINHKGRLSAEWLSLFEGHHKLIYLDTSMGIITNKRLMPLIKFGDPTAIELVLIYSAAVASDGADSDGMQSFEEAIKNNFSGVLEATIKKNRSFLDQYPSSI